MAGKRGRPSVGDRNFPATSFDAYKSRHPEWRDKTLANKVYEHMAQGWLLIREDDRERFAWLLERSAILYELGRCIDLLHKKFPDDDYPNPVHAYRRLALAMCQERPKVTAMVAVLRQRRLDGSIIKSLIGDAARPPE
jgi:hypothetical protein